MNQSALAVFYIIKQGQQFHYIFKKNVLRIRLCESDRFPGGYFLQFIQNGDLRVGFNLSKEEAEIFHRLLPSPPLITAKDDKVPEP